ncbi:unnamed protein product [Rotaria socialis]|uniref:Uncharacterized protein n=3 Tax=Rotaria socialis TaxID=392032 RepID=A0A818FL58_9BILA|nr:unnamed protein product [Rotaria socialis]CAF4245424.1 unnamed protein product [Rotaria socialis]
MMETSEIGYSPNEDQGVQAFIRTLNSLRNDFLQKIKQYTECLREKIFLISISSISLLIVLFFYTFAIYLQPIIFVDFNKHVMSKTMLKPSIVSSIQEPYIYSKNQYFNRTRKPSENVIAFLVASFAGDIRRAYNPYPKLGEKLFQLDERLGDNKITDIIIFHTGYPFRADITSIVHTTARNVLFVNVDHIFYKFSPGFDPHIRDPTWTQKGKWHYHHMRYFWFKQVFELKIIQRYRYMMRLDDDSGIEGKWPNVFEIIAKRQAVYMANRREVDFNYVVPGVTLVRNLTVAFMKKYKIKPRNPDMMADVFNHTIEIPNYWNNVEVIDLSLIRQIEVIDFMRWVDESRGIFLYRWGDAPLRYITLALFVNATQILHLNKLGLGYCHPC